MKGLIQVTQRLRAVAARAFRGMVLDESAPAAAAALRDLHPIFGRHPELNRSWPALAAVHAHLRTAPTAAGLRAEVVAFALDELAQIEDQVQGRPLDAVRTWLLSICDDPSEMSRWADTEFLP